MSFSWFLCVIYLFFLYLSLRFSFCLWFYAVWIWISSQFCLFFCYCWIWLIFFVLLWSVVCCQSFWKILSYCFLKYLLCSFLVLFSFTFIIRVLINYACFRPFDIVPHFLFLYFLFHFLSFCVSAWVICIDLFEFTTF